jgi:predicted regulator of Ras-like GTPase activity (Roadblock/LC7/MglB family)
LVFDDILKDLLSSVTGARAAIFLDNDGESIAQAGDDSVDLRFQGAWKEIHLGHIKEISERIGMGTVHAVLFSLDERNEVIAPVAGEYCLLLYLSAYANVQEAMKGLKVAIERLRKEVE